MGGGMGSPRDQGLSLHLEHLGWCSCSCLPLAFVMAWDQCIQSNPSSISFTLSVFFLGNWLSGCKADLTERPFRARSGHFCVLPGQLSISSFISSRLSSSLLNFFCLSL